jgi:hypothetical protein
MANGGRRGISLTDPNSQNHQPRLQMNDTPIYTSKRTARSLWQEYRIYRDRLELQSWFLFHTIAVPANEIQAVEVRPPGPIWGVKLDNCNFCRHVLLIKKSGLFKRIGFSPDEPDKFVAVCQSIMPGTA